MNGSRLDELLLFLLLLLPICPFGGGSVARVWALSAVAADEEVHVHVGFVVHDPIEVTGSPDGFVRNSRQHPLSNSSPASHLPTCMWVYVVCSDSTYESWYGRADMLCPCVLFFRAVLAFRVRCMYI